MYRPIHSDPWKDSPRNGACFQEPPFLEEGFLLLALVVVVVARRMEVKHLVEADYGGILFLVGGLRLGLGTFDTSAPRQLVGTLVSLENSVDQCFFLVAKLDVAVVLTC